MQDRIETTKPLPMTEAEFRRRSEARWMALPKVLKATFELTRKSSLSQSLQSFGVAGTSSRIADGIYESGSGRLVVTVWHDRIERAEDGSLSCIIDAAQLTQGRRVAAERVARLRELLQQHVDEEIYVVLLKRGWDSNGAQKAERNAPDCRMWWLESDGTDRFVLRRELARKAA